MIIDKGLTFEKYVEETVMKAEKVAAALARLLPNVGSPSANKRRILFAVIESIILYAAPVWRKAMNVHIHKEKLIRVQKTAAIRTCSAYRTISTEAVLVIAGMILIEYQVKERAQVHSTEEQNRALQKGGKSKKHREMTTPMEWHGKRQMTRRLIQNIQNWTERGHGEADYYLTQFLSGHGCFNAYLNIVGKAVTDECRYCGEVDAAEHEIFECKKWEASRRQIIVEEGEITPDNIIEKNV